MSRPQQSKDCLRLDETMLVKQLLPEICHFIYTYREGHQHAAELRASASAVLFSLSCNNFNAVFSRISTRWRSDYTLCLHADDVIALMSVIGHNSAVTSGLV